MCLNYLLENLTRRKDSRDECNVKKGRDQE
jgi:hypothetical protein